MDHYAFQMMETLGISVYIDPTWSPDLGPDKWVAGVNLRVDEGRMGSSMTGWMEGEGLTLDSAARGATAIEAVYAVIRHSKS